MSPILPSLPARTADRRGLRVLALTNLAVGAFAVWVGLLNLLNRHAVFNTAAGIVAVVAGIFAFYSAQRAWRVQRRLGRER